MSPLATTSPMLMSGPVGQLAFQMGTWFSGRIRSLSWLSTPARSTRVIQEQISLWHCLLAQENQSWLAFRRRQGVHVWLHFAGILLPSKKVLWQPAPVQCRLRAKHGEASRNEGKWVRRRVRPAGSQPGQPGALPIQGLMNRLQG